MLSFNDIIVERKKNFLLILDEKLYQGINYLTNTNNGLSMIYGICSYLINPNFMIVPALSIVFKPQETQAYAINSFVGFLSTMFIKNTIWDNKFDILYNVFGTLKAHPLLSLTSFGISYYIYNTCDNHHHIDKIHFAGDNYDIYY